MSGEFLSPEWFARLDAAAAGAAPPYRGPGLVVEVRVVGGDDGPLTYHVVLEDGAPLAYRVGPADGEADASYDQTWEDAAAQAVGRYDPAVGFMQGTLKVKGSSRPLFELFRLWADPAHREALVRLGLEAGLGA
ncbi:MAG: hypothetical protein GEV08_08505 [Acidimicrobiia bacterium]|nr:hypothetical protein [Acidimicrobiia bacterium]